jgi:hypothetical protein
MIDPRRLNAKYHIATCLTDLYCAHRTSFCVTGLGYGLGAMGNIGNDIRDYRQEGEIQKTEIELEQSKAREAQLEQRIKALEEASAAAK